MQYLNQNSNSVPYRTREYRPLADCQLVTAVNAYTYLYKKSISQNGDFYVNLRILTRCIAGSCICIEKAWKKLGITEDKRFKVEELDKFLKPNCFIEAIVWHKHYGFHSTSIIDYVKKAQIVKMTNFRYATSSDNWIFLEDLKKYLHWNIDKSSPRYCFRTYRRS